LESSESSGCLVWKVREVQVGRIKLMWKSNYLVYGI
jgi:hypothetical protein